MLSKTALRQAAAPVVRLYASEPMSLEQVGTVLGLSRERVRQVEQEALTKCAAMLAQRGYRLEDLIGDPREAVGLPRRRIHRDE